MRSGQTHPAFDFRLPVLLLVIADLIIDLFCGSGRIRYCADRTIFDFQFLSVSGKGTVDPGRLFPESFREGGPVADQLRGDPADPIRKLIQRIKKVRFFPPVFQDPQFVLIIAVVG